MRRKSQHFQFKQFTIYHDRATMKVGTDGVLLGAWTNVDEVKNILDIGTGTGVIALMLAQRTPSSTQIDAVEIDSDNARQAIENILLSPWPEKTKVHHVPIQNYNPEKKYDLIVSNPPYFQNSFKPPDEKRLRTRHTVDLSFSDLIQAVKKLLNTTGRFNIILPYQEGLEFIDLAKNNSLYCTRQCGFRSRADKPIERWLLEFSLIDKHTVFDEIILYQIGEEWSERYKALTKEFYLKL